MNSLMERTDAQTILIAEDDPNDAFFLNLAFTRARQDGLSLRFTTDGRQAIEYLLAASRVAEGHARRAPSLLVLDLDMPRFNGIDLLNWLDAHRELINFPVVVLTGSLSDFHYRESMRFDFVTAFLLKSERFDHLPSMLQQIREIWLERRN